MEWTDRSSVLVHIDNSIEELNDIVRIAAFDLDDTLLVYRRGKQLSNAILLDDSLPGKIEELINDNYAIVIFSNQSGMSKKTFPLPEWKEKVRKLKKILFKNIRTKYYFAIYAAKTCDMYRKPNVGMWEMMKNDIQELYGPKQFSKKSFFVGDAGGRTEPSVLVKRHHPQTKKDHSDVDRKFALNVRIDYMTPDQFYLGEDNSKYELQGFNPAEYYEKITKDNIDPYVFTPRKKELIVMVGLAGSGKTTFVKNHILDHDYEYINRDTLKTMDRCYKEAEKHVKNGKSMVIDNTGLDVLSRMRFTTLARSAGYKHIRCIIMDVSVCMANHMNNLRHVYSNGEIPLVPTIAYVCNRLFEPNSKEFFDKIEKIPFQFDAQMMEDSKWKKIFFRLTEAVHTNVY